MLAEDRTSLKRVHSAAACVTLTSDLVVRSSLPVTKRSRPTAPVRGGRRSLNTTEPCDSSAALPLAVAGRPPLSMIVGIQRHAPAAAAAAIRYDTIRDAILTCARKPT